MAAGRCRVHHGGDTFQMHLHARPLRRTRQNNDGNLPARKILLVANSPVRSERKIDRRCLGHVQQGAIVQPVPTSCLSGDDGVAGKRDGKAPRCSVVKENEHRRAWVPAPAPIPLGSAPQNLKPRQSVLASRRIVPSLLDAQILKIFDHCSNGQPGIPKNPRAAHLAGDALHGGAL
jgi:hypothetical protein